MSEAHLYLNACLLCAAGVMEVVAGIIDQCGSESDTKWQGEHHKRDHNPKVASSLSSGDGDNGDGKWQL